MCLFSSSFHSDFAGAQHTIRQLYNEKCIATAIYLQLIVCCDYMWLLVCLCLCVGVEKRPLCLTVCNNIHDDTQPTILTPIYFVVIFIKWPCFHKRIKSKAISTLHTLTCICQKGSLTCRCIREIKMTNNCANVPIKWINCHLSVMQSHFGHLDDDFFSFLWLKWRRSIYLLISEETEPRNCYG